MSNYPNSYDNNATLPPVNDNITEIGGDAINSARSAIISIEKTLGLVPQGSVPTVSERLNASLNPDGSIKPSAIASMGLVTLPITNVQIDTNAGIKESKLSLDHKTQDLYNYLTDVNSKTNQAIGWISTTGLKLDPHIYGAVYRHVLSHIDVSQNTNEYFKNKFNLLRDNSSAFSALSGLNDEFVIHQHLDGSPSVALQNVPLLGGGSIPSYFAHAAGGINVNSSTFTVIPQEINDLQKLAEFIDAAGIFLYGSRIQNLYSNGIPKISRSSSLTSDGYGSAVCEEVPAIAYLLNGNLNSAPFDDIDEGDDIIQLKPQGSLLTDRIFDQQFSHVKVGDIIRVNYGLLAAQFLIKEKKYIDAGSDSKFYVRIVGKNLLHTETASVRIDRPLVNNNKFGVLATAAANNTFNEMPSLIVGTARGAMCLGNGFNADHFDSSHYMLYLALYPTGNPLDEIVQLPGIDVTGDAGKSEGTYTLSSIVEATNNAFRKAGYNYRFIAYSNMGEFGIMLADSYNNASFSVISAIYNDDGAVNTSSTSSTLPKNVIDLTNVGDWIPDPLGFNKAGAAIASPLPAPTFTSSARAVIPTFIFRPLKRNNYYVNGIEREKFALDVGQSPDLFGDGYWTADLYAQNVFPGLRVETTFRINQNLASSGLKPGKTVVIQKIGVGTNVDFGRFIVKETIFECSPASPYTQFTVYDAVHGKGSSPNSEVLSPVEPNQQVAVYLGPDSVSFNLENSSDATAVTTPFKRFHEVYVNDAGKTFTHERSRINISNSSIVVNGATLFTNSELSKLNILSVSPKLRGYQDGAITKITLKVTTFNPTTNVITGLLCFTTDNFTFTKEGKSTTGRFGQKLRFFDETNVDYIDVVFDLNQSYNTTTGSIDFQLYPTLSLDEEIMMISTCQLNDDINKVTHLTDVRQFGNIGEKEFSNSAVSFINSGNRHLHTNGVIRGFEATTPSTNKVKLNGGLALVNGKFIHMNDEFVILPKLKEYNNLSYYTINWAICVNENGEYQPIALLDNDYITDNFASPNRQFVVYGPANPNPYVIDSTTFSDLVNKRKDLTILYIATSDLFGNINHITDVKKFINDGDSITPFVYTDSLSQGNVRSAEAALTWLKFNHKYNNKAVFTGTSNNVITQDYRFDYTQKTTIDGNNVGSITFANKFVLGSNVHLKGLTLNITAGLEVLLEASNITFEDCNINYQQSAADISSDSFVSDNCVMLFSNSSNVNFKNCTITVTALDGYNFTFFKAKNSTNIHFDNVTIIVNLASNANNITVFNFSEAIDTVSFINSRIYGKFFSAMLFNNYLYHTIDNIKIQNNIFNTSCTNYTINDNDLVNYQSAIISVIISENIDSFDIENNTFIATKTRNGYVTFLMSGNNTESGFVYPRINKLNIVKNSFLTSKSSIMMSGSDDFYSAIAIINISPTSIDETNGPSLVNANISENICNSSQSIVLSSALDGYVANTPGLIVNQVKISKNVCGSIGYCVTAGKKFNSYPTPSLYETHGRGKLYISKNTAKFIGLMSGVGRFFDPTDLSTPYSNRIIYGTGYVSIVENFVSWIITALFDTYDDSSLLIQSNNLNAYNESFLTTINVPYNEAIKVLGQKANGGL